jgi:hypothetical protein
VHAIFHIFNACHGALKNSKNCLIKISLYFFLSRKNLLISNSKFSHSCTCLHKFEEIDVCIWGRY